MNRRFRFKYTFWLVVIPLIGTHFLTFFCPTVMAQEQDTAYFALVIGVNKSVDQDLKPLRYADDDAARYHELFQSLGFRSYILSRFDEDTQRLHPGAYSRSMSPRREALQRAARLIRAGVQKASDQQLKTVLYIVYAGHGNQKNGKGYISLEDARITGARLQRDVITPIMADQVHLIVDACYSYFLAYSRGVGGERRTIHGFSQMKQTLAGKEIGLLLSTSAAQESHEWEAFQSGVFSHEVRSGLYGAADADADGKISYQEIAAFIGRANQAIPNERFRPKVFARPPSDEDILINLRPAPFSPEIPTHSFLEVDGKKHGHYYLEDAQGVRLADFHNSEQQMVRLFRPLSSGILYLHQVNEQKEYRIKPSPGVVKIARLNPKRPRSQPRGAEHHAFSLIFALPFDREVVAEYQHQKKVALKLPSTNTQISSTVQTLQVHQPRPQSQLRTYLQWGTMGLGAAALTGGILFTLKARSQRTTVSTTASNSQALEANEQIRLYNIAAASLYGLAGASTATSIILFLWPSNDSPNHGIAASRPFPGLGVHGSF